MNIDLVLWILLMWPIFLFYIRLAIIALLPHLGLYNLHKKILKFNGENLCNSQLCKKLEQVRQNAWKMAKHQESIMLLLKRNENKNEIKEKHSKKSIVDTEEILTIEGISHEVKHATFEYNRTIYFTIMLYYSSVFTAAYWPRFFYLCDCFDFTQGFDMNFGSYIWGYHMHFWIFIFVYLAFFLPCCFKLMGISISPENHLTVAEAAKYLIGSPDCYVKVHCYHTEGSSNHSKTVTTFQTDIEVPVARWIDRGNINMAEITFDLNKMLAKKNVLQLSQVLQVTPADDETKKQLKDFRDDCIASNKHRDSDISATVIYKMMRHGKQVDDLVVFKEGTAVPKQWLSKGDSGLLYLFFALGTPFAAVVFLYWKINTQNVTIKKQIVMKYNGV